MKTLRILLLAIFIALCALTPTRFSFAQTGSVTILVQEDLSFDPTVYKRMWYGLNDYALWIATQPTLPLCNPVENFRGRIDDISLWTPYRVPHLSPVYGAPNSQVLKQSPSFLYGLPFLPGPSGDCYLGETEALLERDKMELFYNQYQ